MHKIRGVFCGHHGLSLRDHWKQGGGNVVQPQAGGRCDSGKIK